MLMPNFLAVATPFFATIIYSWQVLYISSFQDVITLWLGIYYRVFMWFKWWLSTIGLTPIAAKVKSDEDWARLGVHLNLNWPTFCTQEIRCPHSKSIHCWTYGPNHCSRLGWSHFFAIIKNFTRSLIKYSLETLAGTVSHSNTHMMEMRRSKPHRRMTFMTSGFGVHARQSTRCCQTPSMQQKWMFKHTVNMICKLDSVVSKISCPVIGHGIKL